MNGNGPLPATVADTLASGSRSMTWGAGRRTIMCLLATTTISSAGPASARRIGLRAALRARISLLVIVYPYGRPEAERDATSAPLPHLEVARRDWPDWLTGARATRAVFRDTFAELALHAEFVRPDREALLHEGPVTNGSVYAAGFAFPRDGMAPPDGLGLAPVRVRPR